MTKGASEVIENKLGKLTCEQVTGRETKTQGQAEIAATIETSMNVTSPFGVVAYEYRKERKRSGESLGTRITILKLADAGKDAKREIGESR